MSSERVITLYTQEHISSASSSLGQLCDGLLRPVASFVPSLFVSSPVCFLAVRVGELSFPQALSFSRVWLIASLHNMPTSSLKLLSNLRLPETPLHLLCDLHGYFWKTPNLQGAFCFPSLCPRENKSERSSISVCLKLQVPGGETE